MGLQIILDVANAEPNELDALAALIGVLRGDAPVKVTMGDMSVSAPTLEAYRALVDSPTPSAAPGHTDLMISPEAIDTVVPPAPAAPLPSDALIQAAAHAAAGAPATDSRGMPWDERIHAGTRATNADGTWRNKRGVDKDMLASVEAELRGTPVADVQEAAVAPVPAPPSPPAAVPAPPQPPVATPAPPTPPPSAPTDSGVVDFMGLMRKVTGMQTAGTLTVAQTSEISATLGIGGVRDLMKPENADKIAMFDALLPPAA